MPNAKTKPKDLPDTLWITYQLSLRLEVYFLLIPRRTNSQTDQPYLFQATYPRQYIFLKEL